MDPMDVDAGVIDFLWEYRGKHPEKTLQQGKDAYKEYLKTNQGKQASNTRLLG